MPKNQNNCMWLAYSSTDTYWFYCSDINFTQYNTATLNRNILRKFKYNKNITNFEMKFKKNDPLQKNKNK